MKKSLFVIAAALISTAAFAQENDHSGFERHQPAHREIPQLQAMSHQVYGSADSQSDRTQWVYTGAHTAANLTVAHAIGNDRN